MSDLRDRELCYDYLIGEGEPGARSQFEERVRRDDRLAGILRECESDLTNFAESHTPDLAPPPRVWTGILDEVRGRGELELPESAGVLYVFYKYGKFIWPAAAVLLLTLNVWQYLWVDSDPEGKGEGLDFLSGQAGSLESAVVLADYDDVMAELQSLQARIEELDAEKHTAENGMALNREKVIILEGERESMRRRIEYLEQNYLSLVELANPMLRGGNSYFGGDVIEMAEVPAAEDEAAEPQQNIWSHMKTLLTGPGVAQIPLIASATVGENLRVEGGRQSLVDGLNSFSSASLDTGEPVKLEYPESFAVAYLNQDTGQAILSVANVKPIGRGENYTVWVRDGEGAGFLNMGSLESLSGNIGVQLPVDMEGRPEFLISVEGEAGSESPSENVVLATKGEE